MPMTTRSPHPPNIRGACQPSLTRRAKPAAPVAPSSGPVASGSGTPGRSGSPMPLSPSWHAASTSNVFAEGASGSDAVGVQ
eukprot:363862-Chlamydomonas_euryale.AAC.13